MGKERREQEEKEKQEKEAEQKKQEEEKQPEKKKKTKLVYNEEALAAFSWFDIPNPIQKGSLGRLQVENALYASGDRTSREVEELMKAITDFGQQVDYKKLCSTEVEDDSPEEQK